MSDPREQPFSEEVHAIYAQLAAQDVEQFFAGYRWWQAQQRLTALQQDIDALQQEITENARCLQAVTPPAVAFAALARLQAYGVDDVDLLDRLLERGEEWLDLTIQRLDYCEQAGLLHDNHSKWCEHALEGAYDWIDSLRDALADTVTLPAVSSPCVLPDCAAGDAPAEFTLSEANGLASRSLQPAKTESSCTAALQAAFQASPRISAAAASVNGDMDEPAVEAVAEGQPRGLPLHSGDVGAALAAALLRKLTTDEEVEEKEEDTGRPPGSPLPSRVGAGLAPALELAATAKRPALQLEDSVTPTAEEMPQALEAADSAVAEFDPTEEEIPDSEAETVTALTKAPETSDTQAALVEEGALVQQDDKQVDVEGVAVETQVEAASPLVSDVQVSTPVEAVHVQAGVEPVPEDHAVDVPLLPWQETPAHEDAEGRPQGAPLHAPALSASVPEDHPQATQDAVAGEVPTDANDEQAGVSRDGVQDMAPRLIEGEVRPRRPRRRSSFLLRLLALILRK